MLRRMATIKERSGSWWVYWKRGGRGGDKQSTTWPTKELAERANLLAKAHAHRITDTEVYRQILGDSGVVSTAPTLDEWIETYLESKTRLTPGTLGGYRADYKNHMKRTFGSKPIDLIQATAIGTWVNGLRSRGYKESSITRYFTLLSAALNAAEKQGVITRNPCSDTDFERDRVSHDDQGEDGHVYLSKKHYKRLREEFSPEWRTFLDFLVQTGERWSEATATAVGDILPSTKRAEAKARVRRAWKRDPGKGRYLGTTKGRKQRELPIPPKLFSGLGPLMEGQKPSAFLFRLQSGGPIDYSWFYKHVWVPAATRAMRCREHPPVNAGVPVVDQRRRRCRDYGGVRNDGKPCGQWTKVGWSRCIDHLGPEPTAVSDCACEDHLQARVTPHDMRHTCASWLLSAGVAAVAVQRRLGHERIDTTTEIYGGLQPEVDDDIILHLSIDELDLAA
jgi:integrase